MIILEQSILSVASAARLAASQEPTFAAAHPVQKAPELVAAIIAVTEAYTRMPAPPAPASIEPALRSSMRTVSAAVIERYSVSTKPGMQTAPPFLRAIGRHYDENLHSSFLASLLSASAVGDLAREFLCALWAHADVSAPFDASDIGFLIGEREVRLDSFSSENLHPSLGARRIDIFVRGELRTEAGTRPIVMVIENKVWSSELVDQTQDYFDVVSGRYPDHHLCFLFLSPGGKFAASDKFRPIRYADVFALLNGLAANKPLTPLGKHLVELYLNELFDIFIRHQQQSLERAADDLRKARHGN